jgi:hypothetical protein
LHISEKCENGDGNSKSPVAEIINNHPETSRVAMISKYTGLGKYMY